MGAGLQQVGAGLQQVGRGAQQVVAGAQHDFAGLQHLAGLQQRLRACAAFPENANSMTTHTIPANFLIVEPRCPVKEWY